MLATFVVESRKGGLFTERSSPELWTLVALAVGLGVGLVLQVRRRRRTGG